MYRSETPQLSCVLKPVRHVLDRVFMCLGDDRVATWTVFERVTSLEAPTDIRLAASPPYAPGPDVSFRMARGSGSRELFTSGEASIFCMLESTCRLLSTRASCKQIVYRIPIIGLMLADDAITRPA
jgi:hypothetical protein